MNDTQNLEKQKEQQIQKHKNTKIENKSWKSKWLVKKKLQNLCENC